MKNEYNSLALKKVGGNLSLTWDKLKDIFLKYRIVFLLFMLFLIGVTPAASFQNKEVTIIENGHKVKEILTAKGTVGDLLKEENIYLNKGDVVKPSEEEPLQEGMVVNITRAFPVIIEVEGSEKTVVTRPSTVQEIIKMAGLKLGPQDRVFPELGTYVKEKSKIKITRVTTKKIVKRIPVNFREERRWDNTLEKGVKKVLREGEKGIREKVLLVTYEDGQEVSRKIISDVIVKKPVNRLVSLGNMQLASREGKGFRYSRVLNVTASAYTYTGNRTYTNTVPRKGTIAVDPRVIPLGTRLYVEGYGYGRAEDVGSSIKNNRIDVFMESSQQALRWGIRRVKVYILE